MVMASPTANRILEALACGRSRCPCARAVTNSKGNSHCPVHNDGSPSLSVATEDGGKVLVRCQAGCAQEAVIAALRERGLWPELRRKVDQHPKGRAKAKETRYEVQDLEGRLAAVHVRKDSPSGKDMWWELPDGTKGLGGVPVSSLPLYGTETLARLPDGTRVVATEGEKATDALRSMGIAAAGTVTGAAETPGTDALEPLVRLSVDVWADQ